MSNNKIIHQLNYRAEHIPWHLFVGSNSYQRILEMGCCFGFSTISLAKKYAEVYACDRAFENLLALKKQANINSIKNIRYFCGFDTPRIPFKDNFFDVVSINSELSIKTNPIFLAEVWRVLKYSGMLYFSAGNKISYKKLQHIREKIAGIFLSAHSRKRKEKNLSIYGYKKLLKGAGFTHTRIFSLIPNYNEIHTIEALDHMTFFNGRRNNYPGSFNLKKVVKDSKIIRKYMAHSFGLFSKKSGDFDNTIDSIIADITSSLNSGRWDIFDSAFQVTQKGTFIFKLTNRSRKQGIIVKVSLNSVARKQLDQNFQQIFYLHENDCIADDVKEIVPRPIMSSSCNGYNYYVEELKSGKTAVSFHESPEILNKILKNAAQKILQLHLATRFLSKTGRQEQENIIEKKIRRIRKFLGNEHNKCIDVVSSYLKKNILTANLPIVFHKGDCSAHNVLVSQNYSICALIDWDQSLQCAFPLVDLINLIESFKRHSLKQGMGNILTGYLFPEKLSVLEKELFSQYCNVMNISKKMFFPLCIICWLEHVTAQDFTHDNKWMKNNVFHVMQYLQKTI